MLPIAIIIGFGLGSLLFRRKILLGGSSAATEPANRAVKASVDGKPVQSYIVDD